MKEVVADLIAIKPAPLDGGETAEPPRSGNLPDRQDQR